MQTMYSSSFLATHAPSRSSELLRWRHVNASHCHHDLKGDSFHTTSPTHHRWVGDHMESLHPRGAYAAPCSNSTWHFGFRRIESALVIPPHLSSWTSIEAGTKASMSRKGIDEFLPETGNFPSLLVVTGHMRSIWWQFAGWTTPKSWCWRKQPPAPVARWPSLCRAHLVEK